VTLTAFANNYGLPLSPFPLAPFSDVGTTNQTMDAAGESFFAVGHILLSSGPGTSKTFDSGCKLHWRAGAVTLSNGSTNFRGGIQDVTAAGVNDDTWTSEPQGNYTSAAAPTASVVNSLTITSGSRSITHGDLIAAGFEMTARGGADSVVIPRAGAFNSVASHSAADTGSGPALVQGSGFFTLEFADGTVGWFDPYSFAHIFEASAAFGSSSTPDEIALVFRLPVKAQVYGAFMYLANLAAADDFNVILYSDPLGTPVAERSVVQDMAVAATGNYWSRPWSAPVDSPFTLNANTDYALSLLPSTTNTLSYGRLNFNTSNGVLRKPTPLGTNWSLYSRSDVTGAFGSQDTTILPLFGLWLAFDDGAGGGGGSRGFGMTGGMA